MQTSNDVSIIPMQPITIRNIAESHLVGADACDIEPIVVTSGGKAFVPLVGQVVMVGGSDMLYFFESGGRNLDKSAGQEFQAKVIELMTGQIREFFSTAWAMCPKEYLVRRWSLN